MKRLPVFASFILFVALCVSAAFWAMQLFKPAARPVAAPPAAIQPELSLDAATALFGGRSANVVASNYQLKGVVDASNAAESVALLSADGKPAQAFGVGTEIAPGVSVKEVHAKYIMLSEGGVIKRVELPEVDTNSGGRSDGVINSPPPPPPIPVPAPVAVQEPVPVPAPVMSASPAVVIPPSQNPGLGMHPASQGRAMRNNR